MYIVKELGVTGHRYGYSSLAMAINQLHRLAYRARDSGYTLIRLYELNNRDKIADVKMEVQIYGNQEK